MPPITPAAEELVGDGAAGACAAGLMVALQDCGLAPDVALLVGVGAAALARVALAELRAYIARRRPPGDGGHAPA